MVLTLSQILGENWGEPGSMLAAGFNCRRRIGFGWLLDHGEKVIEATLQDSQADTNDEVLLLLISPTCGLNRKAIPQN